MDCNFFHPKKYVFAPCLGTQKHFLRFGLCQNTVRYHTCTYQNKPGNYCWNVTRDHPAPPLTVISMRRFWARPAAVSLDAIGTVSAYPVTVTAPDWI